MNRVIFEGIVPGYGSRNFRIVISKWGAVIVETKEENALGEEYWETLEYQEMHEVTDWELAVLKYYIQEKETQL